MTRRQRRRGSDHRQCSWDGCDQTRFHDFPLCFDHLDEIAVMVTSIDWNERHAAAISESRARQASERRDERAAKRAAQLSATRGDQPGWIYYLQVHGMVKIGFTTDIARRIRQYPPSCELLAVHPGTPELERELHARFGEHLARGREWFRPDPQIIQHCRSAVADYGDPQHLEYHPRSYPPPPAGRDAPPEESPR